MADEVFDIEFRFESEADDALEDIGRLEDNLDDLDSRIEDLDTRARSATGGVEDLGGSLGGIGGQTRAAAYGFEDVADEAEELDFQLEDLGEQSRSSGFEIDNLAGSLRGSVLPFLTAGFAAGLFAGALGFVFSNSASVQNAVDSVTSSLGRMVDAFVGRELDEASTNVSRIANELTTIADELERAGDNPLSNIIGDIVVEPLELIADVLEEARKLREGGAGFGESFARGFLSEFGERLGEARDNARTNLGNIGVGDLGDAVGFLGDAQDVIGQDRSGVLGDIGSGLRGGLDDTVDFIRGIQDRIGSLFGEDPAPQPTSFLPGGGDTNVTVQVNITGPVSSPAQARVAAREGVAQALSSPSFRHDNLRSARG